MSRNTARVRGVNLIPTGVYPRSIKYRRKMAEISWNYQHKEKRIWRHE